MRLKQIKLAGFKSFVDVTKIPFTDPLTAIIGPNGCGKSNTIDAVRWVLGESSAKHLRGDSMTDVIFNGSSARKPVSVASVELLFENLDGRLSGPYAAYQEIAIKRQVNRNGEASYFLNGQKCRRKDITDLFMGTGLGPRSYAIIGQGTISRLIESKPQELRTFIEEAAGISRYKERRKDTENRIRHTRENLDRLNDIRHELGTQLEKLASQAEDAIQYRDLKQQERDTHGQLLLMRYQALMDKTKVLDQQISALELELNTNQAEKATIEQEKAQVDQQVAELERQEQAQVQMYYQTGTEVARLEQQLSHVQAQDSDLQQLIAELAEKRSNQQEAVQQLTAEIADTEQQKQPLDQSFELQQEQLEEFAAQLVAFEAQEEQAQAQLKMSSEQQHQLNLQLVRQQAFYQQHEQDSQRLQQQLNELRQPPKQEMNQTALRLLAEEVELAQDHCLQQAEQVTALSQQYEQQQQRVQQSAEAQSECKAELAANQSRQQFIEQLLSDAAQGKYPKVWQELAVHSGWEQAVELLLGDLLNQSILPAGTVADPATIPAEQYGFIAAEQETTKSKPSKHESHDPLSSSVNLAPWLQQLQWLDNLEQALARQPQLTAEQRIITQDGYLLGQGFILKHQPSKTSVVALQNELSELLAQAEVLQSTLLEKQQHYQQALSQLQQLQQALTQAQQQDAALQVQYSKAESTLEQASKAFAEQQQAELTWQQKTQQLKQEFAEKQQQTQLANEQLFELEAQVVVKDEQHQHCAQQLEQQQAQLKELTAQLQSKKQQQQALVQQQQALATQLALLTQRLQQQQSNVQETDQALAKAQLQLQQAQAQGVDVSAITQKLQELVQLQSTQQQQLENIRLQLSQTQQEVSQWQQKLTEVIEIAAKISQKLGELKVQREGGKGQAEAQRQLMQEAEINMAQLQQTLPKEAKVEIWQQKLDQLKLQISRLGAINLAAIDEFEQQNQRKLYLDSQNDDLITALDSLAQAIRQIDRETRARFKATFEQVNQDLEVLFPKVFGGGHAYLALTDDDLLEAGVTIMARPPGKKNSTIHLLSGGEKALTALSLVFAIFRLNPAPFCMLDEVDAPLDDANVGRFCRLLEEMSQTVQFIYISHNKITMEMADQLIGVTMQEPGVSRIVAVNIEEAVAMADA